MNYSQAIAYIESLSPTLEHPTIDRIDRFLEEHGSPQQSFSSLHVAGTNGKGSTVAMLDAILVNNGIKTARFIGPHLLRWNERLHIGGKAISDAEFADRISKLKNQSETFGRKYPELGPLTWFEFLTALAFVYFAENRVDVAVIEVGLGGRFDATNVLKTPLATAITNVSLDHTHILGNTIEEIAAEKAGIIKRKAPLITAAAEPAFGVICAKAKVLEVPIISCLEVPVNSEYQNLVSKPNGTLLQCLEAEAHNLSLRGFHQKTNALIALEMLNQSTLLSLDTTYDTRTEVSSLIFPSKIERLNNYQTAVLSSTGNILRQSITLESALNSLKQVYWPGRLQLIDSMSLILDVAHNVSGIESLRTNLTELFPKQSFQFVFACYKNKDGITMLEHLLRPGDSLYLSDIASSRPSFPSQTLKAFAEQKGIAARVYPSIAEAWKNALSERETSQYIIATGSFGTVKEVMQALNWQSVEDGSRS